MLLSCQSIREYEEKGYTIIDGAVSPEHVEVLRARVEDYLHGRRPLGPGMALKYQRCGRLRGLVAPKTKLIRKIKHMEHDDLFWDVIASEKIVTPIRQVLGDDVKIFRADLFYKAPRTGWAISMHQDAVYWPVSPIAEVFGTTCNYFLFLDDATAANGGLGVLPGRHREGPLPARRYDGDNGGERRIEAHCYRAEEKTWIEVAAGDALLFHGMLPHFSERNRSGQVRRALNLSCWSARLRHTGFHPEVHGHADSDIPFGELKPLCGRSFAGCV
jgi:phytanoyl-CoA hydroxylase